MCLCLQGDFKWVRRSRIKVTLLGENGDLSSAIDLYESNSSAPPGDAEPVPESLTAGERTRYDSKMKKVLPYLALNEVFIGETMAARVSHLHISKDGEPLVTKTKSSGLCVSTGTGSTSWLTSINRLSAMNMRKLLEILERSNVVQRREDGHANRVDEEAICEEYNNRLIFSAGEHIFARAFLLNIFRLIIITFHSFLVGKTSQMIRGCAIRFASKSASASGRIRRDFSRAALPAQCSLSRVAWTQVSTTYRLCSEMHNGLSRRLSNRADPSFSWHRP